MPGRAPIPSEPRTFAASRLFCGWGSKVAVLVVMLAACSAVSKPRLDHWVDRSVDFADLQTFALVSSTGPSRDPRDLRDRTWDPQIRAAITEALETKGLQQAEDRDPDLIVHFEYRPPDAERPEASPRFDGVSVTVGGGGTDSLYFELRDGATGLPVWRGRARNAFGREGPTAAEIATRTAEIFATYPP